MDLNSEEPSITFRGKTYVVALEGARFVEALANAKGVHMSTNKLIEQTGLQDVRFDRIRKKLPKNIRDRIESEPGKGYRLSME